ncbi:MAG TPA: hypothetical protein VIM65_13705 [Cyclobacteriaceae bacterium]
MRSNYSGKRFLLLFLFVTLSFLSYAQINRDVIYLKNGSIIKGIVMEMVPGGVIKIKTADGSIFIYQMEEVVKMEKEEDLSKKPGQNTSEDGVNDKGYFLMARVGPCINPESDNVFTIIPSFITGVKLNDYLSIGVGVETLKYSFTNDQVADITMYPVFLDTRFYIPRKRVQPMFSLQVGYAFGGKTHFSYYPGSYIDFAPKSHSGGVFTSLGAGMRTFLNKKLSFVFDGGVAFQSMNGYSSEYQSSSQAQLAFSETRTMASLRVNVGFAINLGNKKSSAIN